MNIILFDGSRHASLLPLTYTKPISELRSGILTFAEKWEERDYTISFLTQDYLQEKFELSFTDDNIYVLGSIDPTDELEVAIQNLEMESALFYKDELIAYRSKNHYSTFEEIPTDNKNNFASDLRIVSHPWDIFAQNEEAIKNDFELITEGRESQRLNETNTVIGEGHIFIEKGAEVNCAVFNITNAYVYIGENAVVMEGSMVRGSLALCDDAQLKMGAKIYGPTTVGPHSKAGGEIGNSVITGYSNKGHDGYLGNSVIGEWCNLGADTNTSNLKNNYASVRLWDYSTERFADTGLQFCGLIMGDHSKCGINTMFNTGTVVGVSANIFGSGFPRNFIPSFSWGGATGQTTYKLNKVYDVAETVMARRKIELDDIEKNILESVFEKTAQYRSWEKA